MRTNIVLDPELVSEAMKITQSRTKREVVHLALRRLVEGKKAKDIRSLVGQNLIDPTYDYKAARIGVSPKARTGVSTKPHARVSTKSSQSPSRKRAR